MTQPLFSVLNYNDNRKSKFKNFDSKAVFC